MPYSDEQFGRLVIEKQLSSREQVAECLKAARELTEEGEPTTLKELLLEYGHLTPDQAAQLDQSVKEGENGHRQRRSARFGDYELLAHLGKGGTANVYLARLSDGGPLALKILHQEFSAKPDVVQRLSRERKALLTLEHPNIVRGLEFGNIEDRFYLSMEFVEGVTLKNYVKKRGPVPEDLALGWMEQVASALDHAHHHGLVHRDIKPKNLVLRKDGVVKVLDFGLSKSLLGEEQDLTQDGATLGTVLYAAPEQLRGAKNLNCRADLYSLGITLYHLLTGHVPFRGPSSTATAALHFERPLPGLKAERPGLSDGICKLVQRMTRKSPAARYQTPAELLADIRLLRREGRVSDREPGNPAAEPKPDSAGTTLSLRRVGLVAGAAAVVVLSLAAVFFSQSGDLPPLSRVGPVQGGLPSSVPAAVTVPSSSVPRAVPAPVPEPEEPAAEPEKEFARFRETVEAHLGSREFRTALNLFEPFPESLRHGEWLTKTIALRDGVRLSARSFLQDQRAEWLQAEPADGPEERLRQVAEAEASLPEDLRQEVGRIREEVIEALRTKDATEPAGAGGPIAEGNGGEDADGQRPEAVTAERDGRAAGNLAKAVAALEAGAGPDPEAEKEALNLFSEATKKAEAGDWPAAAKLLRSLHRKHPGSRVIKENTARLVELAATAASETAGPERMFAGKILKFEKGELEILYDFTDPAQLRDWIPLGGQWAVSAAGLKKPSSGKGEVLWWRHPHSPKFRFRFDARGHSYLSCIVAGNGLFAEPGEGLVCGLGHSGGNRAVIRSGAEPRDNRDSQVHQVLSTVSYPVDVLTSRGALLLRSGGDVKLRHSLKRTWAKVELGGWLRCGLFGWGGEGNRYANVRILTRVPEDWVKLERSRIRAEVRARAGALPKNHALRFDGEQSYAVVPAPTSPLVRPPFTVEFRFHAYPEARKELVGTAFSLGLEGRELMVVTKVTPRELQIGLHLGTARVQPSTRLEPGPHHLAVTLDEDEGMLYLDGRRLAQKIPVRLFESVADPIVLGCGPRRPYHGLVDDLRISRKVRYDGVFKPEERFEPDEDTVLLLDFNEGEGNMAFDRSGSGNHAYLYGTSFLSLEDEGKERGKE